MFAPFAHLLRELPVRLRRRTAPGTYRPEIDGLRFLAIAIVVVGHLVERLIRFFPAAQAQLETTPGGVLLQRPGLGVYLFFAVSGFVLATQAANARAHPLSPTFLRAYFVRRLLRIEPPYVLLLAATFLFITATGFSPSGVNQFAAAPASLDASFAGSLFYLHDLTWGTYPRLFPPGWSLEVEVQFYLVAPFLFGAWLLVPRGRARVWLGVAGLLLGSLSSLLAPSAAGPIHLEASLLRYAHFFWLGLLLADWQSGLAQRLKRVPSVGPTLVGWGALALYLLMPAAPDATSATALAYGLLLRAGVLACIAAMFAAALAPQSGFRRFCAMPWVSLLGGACYSIYLTHLQLIQAMTAFGARLAPGASGPVLVALALLELAVVLACGLAFYAVVERSFMRSDWPAALRRRLRSRRPATAA